ncbi:MAG: DoxX family protein [Flavobacteriales bacterium]|nr:DoxX family protein [Flavobacteriales bacterium]
MRALLLISRLIVGPLFIVSGLIKANDPLGFSYKLEEYFAESALNLPFLEPWALTLAILACVAEIVLGFAVIFGGRMRLATSALVVLTVFFGWLTAYTATCDPSATYTVLVNGQEVTRGVTCVTDCGCFGDAMKGSVGRSLTPWESFAKDAVLFVFILPLFIASWRKPGITWNTTAQDLVLLPFALALVAVWSWVFTWWGPVWFTLVGSVGYLIIKRVMQGQRAEWAAAAFATMMTLVFSWWCINHLPVRDYRPYAIGKSIAEQKTMGRPPVQRIYMLYRHVPTGEVKEYDASGAYPWDDEDYEYVDRRIVELEPGIDSPVQDFVLTDIDGMDVTNDILAEEGPVLLVLTYDTRKSATSNIARIRTLSEQAFANGWYVYGVSANGFDRIEEFRHEHQLPFDFLQCDEKTIKTMARANPAVVLLKQGVVKGLWHANDTPAFEEAKARL